MTRWIVLALLLTGCAPPSHSAQWFADHPEDAAATVNRCVATGDRSAECEAARQGVKLRDDARLQQLRKSF